MRQERLKHLKDGDGSGEYVVYWMQQSQRIHYNHALNYAVDIANKNNLPLVVYFALYGSYPEANERSYAFMLEGLVDVKNWLERLGVNFVFRIGEGHKVIFDYLEHAHTLVMDYGYLRHQKAWRKEIVKRSIDDGMNLSIDMIDTDMIVPVEVASTKQEYGAYTIRPKLMKMYHSYRDMNPLPVLINKTNLFFQSDDDLKDLYRCLLKIDIDHKVSKSTYFKGGYIEASKIISHFIYHGLNEYKDRNDPSDPKISHMSMYLHFGQISSMEIIERIMFAAQQHHVDQASVDAFVEQILVRRELAYNYVTYNEGYDQFDQMTQPWAYETMKIHNKDQRPYLYTIKDYELFRTHDEAFNAAMIEMIVTGYMHNYMRMYWAKKIIEWSPSFKEAYETILYLNNKYFIDGRDANSYAGVAWCFGNHDRAWTEREVFGKLRYMNFEGLKRKFNIQKYIDQMKSYL